MTKSETSSDHHDKFARLNFTSNELRSLPNHHAGFLTGSCLAINEITIFQRVLLLALNTRANDTPICNEALQEIVFTQVIILERNQGAKVLEYIKMIGDYQKKCERACDNSMDIFCDKAREVVSKLKNNSGYELAVWYRNKITNHYLMSELGSLLAAGSDDIHDVPHPNYLHEKDGNSYYLLAEQIILRKLPGEKEDAIAQLDDYGEWVATATACIMKLHHQFCIDLIQRYFPSKQLKELSFSAEPHLVANFRETCLPILWRF